VSVTVLLWGLYVIWAQADRMQEQLDTAMFSGKRKQHAVLPLPDLPPTQIPSGEKLPLRNTHYHILNLVRIVTPVAVCQQQNHLPWTSDI